VVTFSRTLSSGVLQYVNQFNKGKEILRWYQTGIETAYRVDDHAMQQTVQLMETVRTSRLL
jgi:hypothetical protein